MTLLARVGDVPVAGEQGGAVGGAAGTAATYPLDLLRTRFAAQGNDRVYASLRRAVWEIRRDEGPRGFFRGLTPALAGCCRRASCRRRTFSR